MKQRTFSIKSSVSKDRKSMELNLEGDLGIKNATAVRQGIMEIELSAPEINFRFQNIEKIDITTIQTIVAVSKKLSQNGKKILTSSEFPPEMNELLKNTGFTSIFK